MRKFVKLWKVTVTDIHKLYKALKYNKEKSCSSWLIQNKTFILVNLQRNTYLCISKYQFYLKGYPNLKKNTIEINK